MIFSHSKKYDNHISIRKIKEAYPEIIPGDFHFKSVPVDYVIKKSQM